MEAQKENIYLNAGGDASKSNLSTPQSGFVIHEDSESTGKKRIKERSSDKKRRVLGDISNKQRDRQRSNNSDGIESTKKGGPGKGLERPTKLTAKKKAKTPLKAKAVASLESKSKTGTKPPRVDEAPDIEFAYGGLSSPTSDSAFVQGLHDEIIQDILNDKTPTLFDEYHSAHAVDDWSDEKAMLESGKFPSSWWSKELEKTDLQEEVEEDYLVFDDVPPPDDLSNEFLGSVESDGLLEDVLSVNVEAVCTE
ncbi:unnamed protein product [Peronospora destructor]|uniref:Uncharacterized protein n=1 Tax=Peronospora destructor TaxID=86335 RepID=A0AAV0U892_9STRA|nr:unnamed protein product [Peronospora destructor]